MSKFYEGMWDKLQLTYKKPKNFTDSCDKDESKKHIGVVECPSICIKMWEEVSISGKL